MHGEEFAHFSCAKTYMQEPKCSLHKSAGGRKEYKNVNFDLKVSVNIK